MANDSMKGAEQAAAVPAGWQGLAADWSAPFIESFALMLADNSGPIQIIEMFGNLASQLFEVDPSRF